MDDEVAVTDDLEDAPDGMRIFDPERGWIERHGSRWVPIAGDWPLVWHWRVRLPERKGQRCRIRCRGAMNSVLVEFPDGFTVLTSRYAVRKARQ